MNCVDRTSQALDRTQPVLPLGLGYREGVTHDWVRHGATTLFAVQYRFRTGADQMSVIGAARLPAGTA
jgi:hypothetical protein